MHAYLLEIRGEDVFVLDEIYIRNGDTPQLAKELERRYGLGIPLVPDAVGWSTFDDQHERSCDFARVRL